MLVVSDAEEVPHNNFVILSRLYTPMFFSRNEAIIIRMNPSRDRGRDAFSPSKHNVNGTIPCDSQCRYRASQVDRGRVPRCIAFHRLRGDPFSLSWLDGRVIERGRMAVYTSSLQDIMGRATSDKSISCWTITTRAEGLRPSYTLAFLSRQGETNRPWQTLSTICRANFLLDSLPSSKTVCFDERSRVARARIPVGEQGKDNKPDCGTATRFREMLLELNRGITIVIFYILGNIIIGRRSNCQWFEVDSYDDFYSRWRSSYFVTCCSR